MRFVAEQLLGGESAVMKSASLSELKGQKKGGDKSQKKMQHHDGQIVRECLCVCVCVEEWGFSIKRKAGWGKLGSNRKRSN